MGGRGTGDHHDCGNKGGGLEYSRAANEQPCFSIVPTVAGALGMIVFWRLDIFFHKGLSQLFFFKVPLTK